MLNRLQISETLHVFDDESADQIRAMAICALKRGHTVTWPNGDIQWVNHDVVVDNLAGPFTTDRYTWHADNQRVLHITKLYTSRSNKIVGEEIGRSYRKF